MIDDPAGGLTAVVYASNAVGVWEDEQLHELLRQSRDNNARLGVSGMLLYRNGRFIQVLEGAPATVSDLLSTIREDRRHEHVRVMMEGPIPARTFAEWTMGFQRWEQPSEPLPAGFRDTFEDLDAATDADATVRAIRELSRWFRHRAARPTPHP